MNRNLSPIEYEGLEYILSRLVAEHQQGIQSEYGLNIHHMTKRTSTGINFTGPCERYYVIDDFTLQGIYLQDGTTILIAYKLAPDSAEPTRQEFPIYIDMTDFMDTEDFDLYYLIWKMREHR